MTGTTTASELSRRLAEVADLAALAGGEMAFVAALRRAARDVRARGPRCVKSLQAGSESALPGAPAGVLEAARRLLAGAEPEGLAGLSGERRRAARELLELPRMTAALAGPLLDALGGREIAALERLALEPSFARLPGCGEPTRCAVAAGLRDARQRRGVWLWEEAHPHAQHAVDALRAAPGIRRVALSGAFRRCEAAVARIDLVVSGREEAVIDVLAAGARFERRPRVLEFHRADAPALACYIVAPQAFASASVAVSSARPHFAWLRERARERGLRLERTGLRRPGPRAGTPPGCAGQLLLPFAEADSEAEPDLEREEAEFYAALGLDWVPPTQRERAEVGADPSPAGRLRGAFHLHTWDSIGAEQLEPLARACAQRGYRWIGLADHVETLVSSRVVRAEDLALRRSEAEAASERAGIEIVFGLGVRIDADGALAAPDALLAEAEFVLGALDPRVDDARRRAAALCHATEDPRLTAIAHPTGRLLGATPLRQSGLDDVFEAAARRRVALEINLHPLRRDLPSALARRAAERGAPLVLGLDACRTGELDRDLSAAGWLARSGVAPAAFLNNLSSDAFRGRGW